MVLVIIGLLAAGILAGKDLIRAAELRSIISEADAYKTAVNTFRLKYNCIPGDCLNATDFFGQKADCSDRTVFNQTCNGNGNGQIDSIVSAPSIGNETFLFWQHLALAGLISGNLNGVEKFLINSNNGVASSVAVDTGVNIPKTKVSNAAWTVMFQDPTTFNPLSAFNTYWGNFFEIGMQDNNNDGWNHGSITTPAESYNIDQKIDDGKPATGKFISRYWSGIDSTGLGSTVHTSTSCTTAVNWKDIGAGYNLANTTISCNPQFIDVF